MLSQGPVDLGGAQGRDPRFELESRIAALDAQQVDAALRRHFDPARLSLIFAGDFGKP